MKFRLSSSLAISLLLAVSKSLGVSFLEEKYDEPTLVFLSLFPESITSDPAKVEELLDAYVKDPSSFDPLFEDAGINLTDLGIAPVAPVKETTTTTNTATTTTDEDSQESNGQEDFINGLFELGSQIVYGSGFFNGNSNTNSNSGSTEASPTTSGEDIFLGDHFPAQYVDGKWVFNSSEVYESFGLEAGMAEVAAYFGIDHTNPDEVDKFVNSFGTCEFCDHRDINIDKTFAGLDCSDWLMFSLFSKQDECSVLRAAAVQYCGCSTDKLAITPATGTCDLCPDGSLEGVNLDQRIPTLSDELLCRHLVYLRSVEGQSTCDAVAGFSYICGCQGATPQCQLCPDGSSPSRPKGLLRIGSDPLTCADFDESVKMNTPNTCPGAIRELQTEVGVDPVSFCGCPNVPQPLEGCQPCQPGYKIREDLHDKVESVRTACQEWATERAPFTVNKAICEKTQEEVMSDCCVEMTQEEIEAEEANNSAAPISHDFTVFVVFQVAILVASYFR